MIDRGNSFLAPREPCQYLPDRVAQMRYEIDLQLTRVDYEGRLQQGWRRFGPVLFRHECPACQRCLSLRVPAESFQPTPSQRRVWTRNRDDVAIEITTPVASPEKLELLARFHRHGHEVKGWPADGEPDIRLFTQNPFATEEWNYTIGHRLVGVGYVDALAGGLSAIYFFHDPDEGRRSLGTFNILALIAAARLRQLPHVYLGYYVAGCRSLEYKARFRPHEILDERGQWRPATVAVPAVDACRSA